MNKKFNICLFIGFFAVAVVLAFHSAGYRSSYITNYPKNFKTNLYILTQKFSLPEPIAMAVPTPDIEEILNTPEPTLTPAPIFDAQKRNEIHAINKSVMIPVQNSANMEFAACDGHLVGADKTLVSFYAKKGRLVSTADVQLSTPILAVNGKYVLAADKGGRKIYLFENTQLIFEADTEDSIICADVSDSGDVVLVCEKNAYKGSVNVYNKKGEMIYAWNSGTDRILDADISGSSRKLAVLTMHLDETTVNSNVLWCDLGSEDNKLAAQYADTLMYDIEFIGNHLLVVGDDKFAAVSGGKADWNMAYSSGGIRRYRIGELLVGAFDIDNLPNLEAFTVNGRKKGSIRIDAHPDCIDLYDDIVAYNDERTLIVGDIAGKKSKSFSCMRDINDIIILNPDIVAVVYSSSVEFIEVK